MWPPTSARPALTPDAIHVWRIGLGGLPDVALLSADERDRATRLKVVTARHRFVSARTHLRLILSRYLDTAPEALRFTHNPHGKPALDGDALHFNLSHTDDLGLLAVAMQPVGVDVERVRTVSNPDYIMRSAFTEHERDIIGMLTGDAALIAFWRAWTRKEAIMKLIGVGFRLAQQFSVGVDEPPVMIDSAALLAYHPAPPILHPLPAPVPDYLAALASYQHATLHTFTLA